ncbi:UNVERIFIED_ORG: GNAT superfamily N-acetyltransferase [Arthrobacter sp. UYCu721]
MVWCPTVAFVTAAVNGPRAAGVLERMPANRDELFPGPLDLHVLEPYEPGSGRIWRYDQHPGLMLNSLAVEYDSRCGDLFGRGAAAEELNRYQESEFKGPGGALLMVQENGESVAGGAFRHYNNDTAEFKRIWTHSAHRRRGLARFVLAELEALAARRGYRQVFLSTGPRQPEAKHLYLTSGYDPQFDLDQDPEIIRSLAFTKNLPAAPLS